MSLELPEIPPISEVFRNLEMSSNLHLITEEPYSSAIENLVKWNIFITKNQTAYIICDNKIFFYIYFM